MEQYLKFTDTAVTFSEIPDEITLCINISNCPIHCFGCHSRHLWEDVGEPLDFPCLMNLIQHNSGITCVCIMGGDSNAKLVENIMRDIKINNPTLKTGWYSGRSEISKCIDLSLFDYIKVGPYMHDRGGLSNPNTNQIMYKIRHQNNKDELVDITNKFWKKSL